MNELERLRGDLFNLCNGDKLLEGADNNACILESYIEKLQQEKAALEGEITELKAHQLKTTGAWRRAEERIVTQEGRLGQKIADYVSELATMRGRAEQAERERDAFREALAYAPVIMPGSEAEATTRRLEEEAKAHEESWRAVREERAVLLTENTALHFTTRRLEEELAVAEQEREAWMKEWARKGDRADKAKAEARRLEAERDMLRGVGCGEAKEGEPASGPCGVCVKCLKAEARRLEHELEELRKAVGHER